MTNPINLIKNAKNLLKKLDLKGEFKAGSETAGKQASTWKAFSRSHALEGLVDYCAVIRITGSVYTKFIQRGGAFASKIGGNTGLSLVRFQKFWPPIG